MSHSTATPTINPDPATGGVKTPIAVQPNPIPWHSLREVRDILVHRFPLAFMAKGVAKLPLAISIHRGMADLVPDVRPHRIASAIADYCNGPSYLVAMIAGAPRFNLNGRPEGVVREEHAADAQRKLAKFGDTIPARFRPAAMQLAALEAEHFVGVAIPSQKEIAA